MVSEIAKDWEGLGEEQLSGLSMGMTDLLYTLSHCCGLHMPVSDLA